MFTINGDDLTAAISDVLKVVGNLRSISVHQKDGTVKISGISDKYAMSVDVPTDKHSGSDRFSVDPSVLIGTVSGRKLVELQFIEKNSIVKVKSGRYNGNLVVMPYVEVEVVPAKVKGLKISSDAKKVILETIDRISLTPLQKNVVALIQLRFDKKAAIIASADNFQAAMYVGKPTSDSFELTIETKNAPTLSQLLSREDKAKVNIEKDVIHIIGENFVSRLPLGMAKHPIDTIMTYSTAKWDGSCKLNSEEVKDVIATFQAIQEDSSALRLKVSKKGKINFQMKTTYGEGSEEIKAKGNLFDLEFKLKPDSFNEILGKFDQDLYLKLSKKTSICGFENKTKNGTYHYVTKHSS